MTLRYAQEYKGQKLHLVREIDPHLNGGRTVANKALCGRNCHKRGAWRLTINMPLGTVCLNCWRIWQRMSAQ